MKHLPLKVTTVEAPDSSSPSLASSAASSPKWRMKICSMVNAPPRKRPTPIRKALVPVPPASPVVSASMKAARSGSRFLPAPEISPRESPGLGPPSRSPSRIRPTW